MKKILAFSLLVAVGAVPAAMAQKFAIKAYDNLGLGNAMQTDDAQPGQESKSGFNNFGIDFGYTFWQKGPQRLEANIGFGYSVATSTFTIDDLKYHYAAPALADEDANPYERYYELSDFRQKSSVGYFAIPIYLSYQYRPIHWLGIYAEAGVSLGFNLVNSVGRATGYAKSFGVFPEYDDLLIDEDYLDVFGSNLLSRASSKSQTAEKFHASVLCGAGLEIYTYTPVSFTIGVRYNAGLTHSYAGHYAITSRDPGSGYPGSAPGAVTGALGEAIRDGQYIQYTEETAPVYYTVEGGQQVRALSDYVTRSRLMPLQLHMGVTLRF